MGFETGLDPTRLPIPKYDITVPVAATDPTTVRREPDLAGVTRDAVSCESFLAVLAEVVGGVDEDLVVEGLCGEVFFYKCVCLCVWSGVKWSGVGLVWAVF